MNFLKFTNCAQITQHSLNRRAYHALLLCARRKIHQAVARAYETGEAMLDMARTRALWGCLLCERDDDAGAREQFTRALAQFEQSGLIQEARQVQAWMEACGSASASV